MHDIAGLQWRRHTTLCRVCTRPLSEKYDIRYCREQIFLAQNAPKSFVARLPRTRWGSLQLHLTVLLLVGKRGEVVGKGRKREGRCYVPTMEIPRYATVGKPTCSVGLYILQKNTPIYCKITQSNTHFIATTELMGGSQPISKSRSHLNSLVELGRYRFFKSVSVFVFWSVFSKVSIGFGIGFSKYRDIGFGFRFFRTNLQLLIE